MGAIRARKAGRTSAASVRPMQLGLLTALMAAAMLAAVACSPPVGKVFGLNGSGAPPAQQAQDTDNTVQVVQQVRPSVVQIITEMLTPGLFNQPVPSQGVGTGVIIDASGNILTNNHVVAQAERITVVLPNSNNFEAQVVGRDPVTDVAVIRINATGLTAATLGDSSQLQVGEPVVAIGHALGLPGGPTVSKGVVSALARNIDVSPQFTLTDLIQTDASINPGNSGGPLVNENAEVIGINTAAIASGQGIGFAININEARAIATELIQQGFVERGFLGIAPVNVTPALANRIGLPTDQGVIIAQIVPGGPVDDAGLSEGDVIIEINGQPISSTGDLSEFLRTHKPGETVQVTYFSDGTQQTASVTLGEQPQG